MALISLLPLPLKLQLLGGNINGREIIINRSDWDPGPYSMRPGSLFLRCFYWDNSQGQDSKETEIWLRRKYQKKALQETIAIEGLIWDCCIIESPL